MILLSEDAYEKLKDEASGARPEESCGVLAGRVGGSQRLGVVGEPGIGGVRQIEEGVPDHEEDVVKRVVRVLPCRNADEEPAWRYTLDPSDQLEAFRTIDEEDLDLIGFYHSHPRGPREPSETDLDRATWTGYSYVIVSLDGDEPWVGSWVFTEDGEFEGERIVVTT